MSDADVAGGLGFLRELPLDGEVSFEASDRGTHDADWGTTDADAVTPAAVVYAESTADVSAVLGEANERGIPVTPYGGGTGLEGGATPLPDGVSLDTTRLDSVVDVRPEDLQVDVGAGVIGDDLNDHLASYGLFLPTVPSSGESATIGGMIATDASGMRTVKYGEVSDWVLAVEAVLPDGTVVQLGSTTAKTSSGYNLKDLVVGSEGTLAVVTRATLELAGVPDQIRGARAVFPTLGDATAAISDAVAAGVDAAAMELLDADTARVANDYSDTGLPDAPLVFCEFHANHAIEAEIDYCRSIFESHGCERFEVAGAGEMDELWEARRDLTFALDTYDPNRSLGQPGDVTVPIGEYRTIVEYVKQLADEYDLFVPCFGHAGDGNVHYTMLVDEDDPEEVERANELYGRVVDRAIELGGTATGEHGIGTGKRKYMAAEHGAAVEPMRAIKEAIDPAGIMNPEKVIPADE